MIHYMLLPDYIPARCLKNNIVTLLVTLTEKTIQNYSEIHYLKLLKAIVTIYQR